MTELKEILNKCLTDEGLFSIIIDCKIPKLSLMINDSSQMILYGIGPDRKQGFTLNIRVDNNSNKGKRIRETLNAFNFLNDFSSFESKRSIIYLKDFEQEIDLITETVQELLNILQVNQYHQLTVNRTNVTYQLE